MIPKRPALAALKAELRRLEGAGRRLAGVWSTGMPAIDAILPDGGLAQGGLHEIIATQDEAALGFAACLTGGWLRQRGGPVLWCLGEGGLPYGPGLARLGLTPDRLILVQARNPVERLWAMEEGLKASGLVAVLAEVSRLDLTASRRLQLAAESSGVTGLVLRRIPAGTPSIGASVAVTRWRISPAPSAAAGSRFDFGLARARWQVELLRCRGAQLMDHQVSWLVEAGDAAGALPMAVSLADGSAASEASILARVAGG